MSEPIKRTEIVAHEAPPAPIVQMGAATLMEVISRAASDPNTDVDKLERLLGMAERITARDSKMAFAEAMKAAQEEMPAVVRDAENDQTKSKYARLETVSDAIDPVIHRHGFTPSFGTADSPLDNHYRVTCKLRHVSGHEEDYFADVPADMLGMKGNQNKTATHAFGSTMSYGRRYLKLLIFDVKLRNEDDDGRRAGNRGQPAAVDAAKAAISACADTASLKAWKAKNEGLLQQLPSDDADAIVRAFNARARELRQ